MAAGFTRDGLAVGCHPVVRTSHPTGRFEIRAGAYRALWAPEFREFAEWAAGAG